MEGVFEDLSLVTAVGAAAISVLSLLVNIVLARRGHRMQAEQLRIDIDAHLLGWAEDVLDVMGRASQLVAEPGADAQGADRERSDILRDLSVLLDQGRWHAPNTPDPRHGAEKPAAYRGFRQPALDCIF
ncbi:MAG: hypothetical protein PVI23_07970, partial [Maricaulaceae bacterium]